jgi:hypothetical protein
MERCENGVKKVREGHIHSIFNCRRQSQFLTAEGLPAEGMACFDF